MVIPDRSPSRLNPAGGQRPALTATRPGSAVEIPLLRLTLTRSWRLHHDCSEESRFTNSLSPKCSPTVLMYR
jgi:hypothetical protein